MIIRLIKHMMNKRDLSWALKAARHNRGAKISSDLGARLNSSCTSEGSELQPKVQCNSIE